MKNFALRAFALLAALAVPVSGLAGCGSQRPAGSGVPSHARETVSVLFGSYQDADFNTEIPDGATKITLSGGSASIEGGGATVSGGAVTIQSAGNYVVSGELADGQLIIDAPKDGQVHVILQNASITYSGGAPLYARQCGKLVLTLADGSENILTDSESYVFAAGEDEPDAALFSKDSLTINGSGSLTVNAGYRNGIASKDGLAVISGRITVTAANDALRGKDSVSILGGDFTLTAGNDGIKSNNDAGADKGTVAIDGGTFVITAGCDGIQAETALTVGDGSFTVTTGGGSVNTSTGGGRPGGSGGMGGERPSRGANGDARPKGMPEPPKRTPPSGGADPESRPAPAQTARAAGAAASAAEGSDSCKGLKAGAALTIHGGSFALDCLDDALHSNGGLTVEGGTFTITTDDDGLHADGVAAVNGGLVNILRCYEGIEGGDVVISGGEIRLTSRDDGVNSAGGSGGCDITISGGLLVVSASGDGLDANGSIRQTGGAVLINGPTSGGDGALDYDGSYEISGGILAAAGSAGMARSVSAGSGQPALFVKFDSIQAAGSAVSLFDARGNPLLSYAPSKDFETIVLSAPGLTLNESYTLSINPDGNGAADGYAESPAAPGEVLCTITLDSAATAVNSDGSAAGGGFGRMGGRRGGTGDDAPPAS